MLDWAPHELEMLRRLWAEGVSASTIGATLGTSKNAVIGKARRLHLESRGSPILRVYDHPRPAPRLARPVVEWGPVVVEPPPPPRLCAQCGNPLTPKQRRFCSQPCSGDSQRAFDRPKRTPNMATVAISPHHCCQYPMNDAKPYVWCDAPTRVGSSYCPHHHAICYTPRYWRDAA